MKRHTEIFIVLSAILFIVASGIFMYINATRESPISISVWHSSTGPISGNSSFKLINQDKIAAWYEREDGYITLALEKTNVKNVTCWRKTFIQSELPFSYSLSYDGTDLFCMQIWTHEKNHNDHLSTKDRPAYIEVLPDSTRSKVLHINQITHEILNKTQGRIATLFIDISGDVVRTSFNPCLVAEFRLSTYLIEKHDDEKFRRTINITKEKIDDSYEQWLLTLEGSDLTEVLIENCDNHRRTLFVAKVTDSVMLQGKVILDVPVVTKIFQYYVAMLKFDEFGNILWNSLAGPFTNGSVGMTAAHAGNDGEVFLIATYKDAVGYWKDDKKRVAINSRKWKIYNACHGINHGQALLVIDNEDGQLLFSGLLADGYLRRGIMDIMPDQSLGFYACVSPRARLVNNNQVVRINDNYPAPPPYIFFTISNAYWTKSK